MKHTSMQCFSSNSHKKSTISGCLMFQRGCSDFVLWTPPPTEVQPKIKIEWKWYCSRDPVCTLCSLAANISYRCKHKLDRNGDFKLNIIVKFCQILFELLIAFWWLWHIWNKPTLKFAAKHRFQRHQSYIDGFFIAKLFTAKDLLPNVFAKYLLLNICAKYSLQKRKMKTYNKKSLKNMEYFLTVYSWYSS